MKIKREEFFKIFSILGFVLFFIATFPAVESQLIDSPWPSFCRDNQNTGLSPYKGSQDNELKWSFQTNETINSTPAIGSDGTIYVGTSWPGENVFALNLDGSLKWVFQTDGSINSSPAIGSDGTVYIGSGDDNLYAINPDGTQKWSFPAGGDGWRGVRSSPAIGSDGTVYIGGEDGNVYALNPDNGDLKWSYKTNDTVYSSPAIGHDGTVYIGSLDENVYALNPDNGDLKWSFKTNGSVYSTPAVDSEGTVYVGSDFSAPDGSVDGYVYAIDSEGTEKWSFRTWGIVRDSPAIGIDGTIYVGCANIGDPNLYALSPDNGEVKWIIETDLYVQSSPTVGSDGTVYIGSRDDYVYALSPDGTVKWSYRTADGSEASPAIDSDGTVYVGAGYNDGRLYAFKGPGISKHLPIQIENDADFSDGDGDGVINPSGTGMENDPYIIENWIINTNSNHGIRIENTTAHFVIRNCIVNGELNDGTGIYFENVKNGRVENTSAENLGYGVEIYDSADIFLYNNRMVNNSYDGISMRFYSENIFVENNICSSNGNGIYLSRSSYNTISGNTCDKNTNYGIFEDDKSYNIFSGNILTKNEIGLYIANNHDDNIFYNICENNSLFGIYLSYSENSILRGNVCKNNIYGIHLWSSDSNILENNNCSNNQDMGIMLDHSSLNTLENNICSKNGKNGVKVYYSNKNSLDKNTCSHNAGSGVLLNNTSNNTISNSICDNNQQNGISIILVLESNDVVINNNCSSNSDYGIYLQNVQHENIIGNTCENNYSGIYLVSSHNNNILNNLCENNSSTNAGNSLQGADFVPNVRPRLTSGISLSNSDNNKIKNNISLRNEHGIYLTSSDNNVIENNVSNSNNANELEDSCGIYLSNVSKNNVSKNTCENNDTGIKIDTVRSRDIIKNNSCSNNRSEGIHLFGANDENLENNTCMNNDGNGILIEYSSNIFITNNISSNNKNGIKIDTNSSNSTIYHNSFHSNQKNNGYDNGDNNFWSNGLEGNYWGNWQAPDNAPDENNDGIIDDPYLIPGAGYYDEYPLALLNLESPRDGSNFSTDTTTLRWTNPILPRYQLQVSTDDTFTNLIKNIVLSNNQYTLSSLSSGTYYWQVKGLDLGSYKTPWTTSQNFVISLSTGGGGGNTRSNQHPIADFTYAPLSPTTSDMIRFTDQSIDPDGSISSRRWDFGDGTESTDKDPNHLYSENGIYMVTLDITDGDGATDTTSKKITVTEGLNELPIADFTYAPISPTTTDVIQFTDNSTDSDGTVENYDWAFGDGSISTAKNPTYIYENAGVFTVNLTVQDDNGSIDSTWKTITVSNAPSKFELSRLTITPQTVELKETIAIDVMVKNIGGETDNYTVILSIDNTIRNTKTEILAPNETIRTSFTVRENVTGIYLVTVEDLFGDYTVLHENEVKNRSPSAKLENTEPGEDKNVSVENSSIIKFRITSKNYIEYATITSREKENNFTGIPPILGTSYKYLNISTENLSEEDLEEVTIHFKVPKSWINKENISENTITLQKYNPIAKKWENLPTKIIGEDSRLLYFESLTVGFSNFVIAGTPVHLPTEAGGTQQLWLIATVLIVIVVGLVVVMWKYLGVGKTVEK